MMRHDAVDDDVRERRRFSGGDDNETRKFRLYLATNIADNGVADAEMLQLARVSTDVNAIWLAAGSPFQPAPIARQVAEISSRSLTA